MPIPHTKINIVEDDITRRPVDAIVNAANSTLLGGGGVDGAIHRAAGPALLAECRTLGGCRTGQAKATRAYGIAQASCIIHTVGSVYGRDSAQEAKDLASCYTESLALAVERDCRSIAFPSVSTGAYGYPIAAASRIALTAIHDFLKHNGRGLDLIEIVTFSTRDQKAYLQAYKDVFGDRTAEAQPPP